MFLKRGKLTKLKALIIGVLLLGITDTCKAQFDGIYSQHMYLKSFYNPASVGEQELSRILVAQRLDWVGITNAPKTTLFTVNTPFSIGKTEHAAGIQLISDIFGIFANQQINLQYAYKHKFEFGVLSVGANIGAINLICYGDSVKMVESDYHSEANADPAIPIGTQTGIGFDLGFGVYFTNATWYAGVSLLHALGDEIQLGDQYDFYIGQMMTINGGYNIKLPDNSYQIKPSVFICTDFTSWQLMAGATLDYKNLFWGGLAYSIQRAVSFSFGMEIIDGLDLGYCYDLPTSYMIQATHGSHEIYLSYDFNLIKPKQNNKYKSIRLL